MSHRHAASDPPDKDKEMRDDYQYSEEEMILPHRGKIREMMQDWLEMLTTTGPPVSQLIIEEKKEGRTGLGGIFPNLLKAELDDMLHMTDVAALDAKANTIDSHLEGLQNLYEKYLTKNSGLDSVKVILGNAILAIKRARRELPGIFSRCVNGWEKARRFAIYRHKKIFI